MLRDQRLIYACFGWNLFNYRIRQRYDHNVLNPFTQTVNLKTIFPHGSNAFFNENSKTNGQLPAPEPQRDKTKSLGKAVQRKEKGVGCVTVRFRRCCVRLLDWDNLAGSFKDLCDGLWRCGAIDGDSPEQIITICEQQKVEHYSDERIEIEIIYP